MREKKRKKRKKLETAGSVLGDHLVTAARGGAHFRAQVVNKNQTDRQLEKKRKNSRIMISRKRTKNGCQKRGGRMQDANQLRQRAVSPPRTRRAAGPPRQRHPDLRPCVRQNVFSYDRMCSLTCVHASAKLIAVFLNKVLQNVFSDDRMYSYYRMYSLTIECVLLL